MRLEGTNGARFIAFRKLKPGIYTIDDCTEDLTDAQDITWWAAVGQTWMREVEARGGKWQRLSSIPGGKRRVRACEWNGQIQGYLDIQLPQRKKPAQNLPEQETESKPENSQPLNEQPIQPEPLSMRQPDDVIGTIGPQAMALLAAGQSRENEGDYVF